MRARRSRSDTAAEYVSRVPGRPARSSADEARERVREAVVGGDQLGLAVVAQVADAVVGIAPAVDALGVAPGCRVPAVEPGVEAAVRAARVEVDEHLRLPVAVEVADPK